MHPGDPVPKGLVRFHRAGASATSNQVYDRERTRPRRGIEQRNLHRLLASHDDNQVRGDQIGFPYPPAPVRPQIDPYLEHYLRSLVEGRQAAWPKSGRQDLGLDFGEVEPPPEQPGRHR